MLYLASKSPRRRELLKQIHVEFESVDIDICERINSKELPEDYVKRIALEKAEQGYEYVQQPGARVLAADTTVVIGGTVLGKPKDRREALMMLERLSGNKHHVLTAVALVSEASQQVCVSASEVTFRIISQHERELYCDTGEPNDKAGAYAIQGIGAMFVKHLSGSYSGVMGLPIYETCELLECKPSLSKQP